MKRKGVIKWIAIVAAAALVIVLLAGIGSNGSSQTAGTGSLDDFEEYVSKYNVSDDVINYTTYMAEHKEAAHPQKTITIGASDVTAYYEGGLKLDPVLYTDYEGMTGDSIYTSENSQIEFQVTVPETGLYHLSFVYYPVEGKNSDIQRSILVDGEYPFKESSLISFPRVWTTCTDSMEKNADGVLVKNWESDNQGNHMKPKSMEIPEWQSRYVYDSDGYVTDPLNLYLEQGTHSITVSSLKEPMLIHKLVFDNSEQSVSYEEKLAEWTKNGAKDSAGKRIRIEGEYATKTSSQMLYPQQDQASCEVYPASAKSLLNNSIGGNSWRLVGQWMEWDFSVREAGFYEIALHDKQNFSRGVAVSRRITIDGEIPFDEMSAYAFNYAQNWRVDVLSDNAGNPYKFYLDAGEHTIRMEVVLGNFSAIVGEVEDTVQKLNDIYRQVIKITGVSPDTYRSYQIESNLPGLTEQLVDARDHLNNALAKLEIVAGKNSDKKTVLLTMRDQLDELIKDNEYFVRVIGSYKTNVRACGNWITQVIYQPLAIDSLTVYSPDTTAGYEKASFFTKLSHEAKRLYYSFVIDYNKIGNVAEKDQAALTLWIGSGRDQANVIKALIDDTFTNETGISVNVQLVDMNTLLKATLVGEGPDVAIQVANTNGIAGAVLNTGNDTPVNYGIRNAVLDLTRFADYKEVLSRFPEAAATQFTYDGALYALPETITYPVMFYRKDILKEIGLEIPTTWDEVKVAMTILAKNQMEFGMLPNEQLFASLLYQNGGEYYNEKGDKSALDSDTAINVFKLFCNYYTDYKIDRATSVEERFRTGECPIILADYTTYNNFAVSAPDIAGLWSFTQIPGTVKEDGSVDHSVACTGLASMIMADTEYPDESWEFVKWWTSAETQTQYGREMETLMGSAARVPTANYEAFTNMPWPITDFKALEASMECVKGIPQVPGGYYSWRNVNNAFYSVVTKTDTSTPREELMDKVIYINAEIKYKREELHLDEQDRK